MAETTVTTITMTADSVSKLQRPVDLELAGVDPGEDRRHELVAVDRDLEEQHDAQGRRDAAARRR